MVNTVKSALHVDFIENVYMMDKVNIEEARRGYRDGNNSTYVPSPFGYVEQQVRALGLIGVQRSMQGMGTVTDVCSDLFDAVTTTTPVAATVGGSSTRRKLGARLRRVVAEAVVPVYARWKWFYIRHYGQILARNVGGSLSRTVLYRAPGNDSDGISFDHVVDADGDEGGPSAANGGGGGGALMVASDGRDESYYYRVMSSTSNEMHGDSGDGVGSSDVVAAAMKHVTGGAGDDSSGAMDGDGGDDGIVDMSGAGRKAGRSGGASGGGASARPDMWSIDSAYNVGTGAGGGGSVLASYDILSAFVESATTAAATTAVGSGDKDDDANDGSSDSDMVESDSDGAGEVSIVPVEMLDPQNNPLLGPRILGGISALVGQELPSGEICRSHNEDRLSMHMFLEMVKLHATVFCGFVHKAVKDGGGGGGGDTGHVVHPFYRDRFPTLFECGLSCIFHDTSVPVHEMDCGTWYRSISRLQQTWYVVALVDGIVASVSSPSSGLDGHGATPFASVRDAIHSELRMYIGVLFYQCAVIVCGVWVSARSVEDMIASAQHKQHRQQQQQQHRHSGANGDDCGDIVGDSVREAIQTRQPHGDLSNGAPATFIREEQVTLADALDLGAIIDDAAAVDATTGSDLLQHPLICDGGASVKLRVKVATSTMLYYASHMYLAFELSLRCVEHMFPYVSRASAEEELIRRQSRSSSSSGGGGGAREAVSEAHSVVTGRLRQFLEQRSRGMNDSARGNVHMFIARMSLFPGVYQTYMHRRWFEDYDNMNIVQLITIQRNRIHMSALAESNPWLSRWLADNYEVFDTNLAAYVVGAEVFSEGSGASSSSSSSGATRGGQRGPSVRDVMESIRNLRGAMERACSGDGSGGGGGDGDENHSPLLTRQDRRGAATINLAPCDSLAAKFVTGPHMEIYAMHVWITTRTGYETWMYRFVIPLDSLVRHHGQISWGIEYRLYEEPLILQTAPSRYDVVYRGRIYDCAGDTVRALQLWYEIVLRDFGGNLPCPAYRISYVQITVPGITSDARFYYPWVATWKSIFYNLVDVRRVYDEMWRCGDRPANISGGLFVMSSLVHHEDAEQRQRGGGGDDGGSGRRQGRVGPSALQSSTGGGSDSPSGRQAYDEVMSRITTSS